MTGKTDQERQLRIGENLLKTRAISRKGSWMTVSRTTTRNDANKSHFVGMASVNSDWRAWLIFAATFSFCHLALSALIVLRAISGEALFSIVFFIFSGLLASLEFLVGYAAVDVVVSVGRASPHRIQRISAGFGGVTAFALAWIVIALRLQLPELSANLVGSITNFSRGSGFPWGAMFLGGISALASNSGALAWQRKHGAAPDRPGTHPKNHD